MKWWFKQQLYMQILICIFIGIALGLVLGPKSTVIKPIGDIFIRLLMMLIVPLTFFTLISGITKLGDLRSLRSVGGMTIFYYAVTSLIAGAVGVALALLIRPGKDAIGLLNSGVDVEIVEFDIVKNIVDWVPSNPIEAMATGHMLQLIVFSIIVGVSMLAMGKKADRIIQLTNDGADLMITITQFVMKLAPYGILALVANMVATLGAKMLAEVGRFILADYVAIAIVMVIVYPLFIWYFAKLNPVRFYRNIAPAILVAASTTSSSATLPISMAVAEKNLGIPEKIWGFTLPLGATINMNGMAAGVGVISVFAANLYGVPITPTLILQFMFLGLALSVGAAGVKGAGIVLSTVLLQTLNMPLTLIPILASIWPVLDVAQTAGNVTGDLIGTTIVASRSKMIDKEIFYGENSHI